MHFFLYFIDLYFNCKYDKQKRSLLCIPFGCVQKQLLYVTPARTFWKKWNCFFQTQFDIPDVSFFFFLFFWLLFFKFPSEQLKKNLHWNFFCLPRKKSYIIWRKHEFFVKKIVFVFFSTVSVSVFFLPRMGAWNQPVQRHCSVLIISSFRFFLVLILGNRTLLISIENHQNI